MKGDLKHLHHRFLQIGLTQRKALTLIYLLCASFGGIAVFFGGDTKAVRYHCYGNIDDYHGKHGRLPGKKENGMICRLHLMSF